MLNVVLKRPAFTTAIDGPATRVFREG